MRAPALLVLVLLLASGAALLPAAELDERGFAPVLFAGVSFHEVDLVATRDMRLHAEVYLPDRPLRSDAPDRFPTVLVLSPYWRNGTGGEPIGYRPYDFLVQELAPRGYAIVYGDLVGSGGSSGCWDFMGPVERAGAVAMVEAIAAQPWSDGKVGMMGISYDAMTQIMAASDRAPHLVTVVPVAPLTHAYGGLMQNGVRYGGHWRLVGLHYESESLKPLAESRARSAGWSERLAASAPCVAENHAAELDGDAYSPYFQARDYRPLGAEVQASVFYIQGFRDRNVKPDNFGAWFDAVPTLKKAWIGSWPHTFPDARGGGRDELYPTLQRWFDHTLKGIDNGIDREPAYDIEDSRGRWRVAHEWPPREGDELALYFSADGALLPAPPTGGSVRVGGVEALPGALPGQPARSVLLTSVTLPDGAYVAGSPVLRLTLASDRPVGQLLARLYDNGWRVTQGAIDLAYRHDLARAEPLVPGEPVEVTITMYPIEHDVVPGRSLVLELATHDPSEWYEDDLSVATLTVATDGSSYLLLPTMPRPHAP